MKRREFLKISGAGTAASAVAAPVVAARREIANGRF
jgi:anaerobic selenocysteine-containing dehydrogenase